MPTGFNDDAYTDADVAVLLGVGGRTTAGADHLTEDPDLGLPDDIHLAEVAHSEEPKEK